MRINLGQGGPVVLAISITNQFDWSYSVKLRKSDETDIVFEKAQLMSGSETVTLAADADEIAPFSIATTGITALAVTTQSMALTRDNPAVLDWEAGSGDASTKMEIELNIANHGGTPAVVQCLSEDSGHFEIPVSMVNALLDLGFSGFPSVSLTRAASNTANTGYGCVDLRTQSTTVLNVDIEGLISCSDNTDCPDDQTCQADLTCG